MCQPKLATYPQSLARIFLALQNIIIVQRKIDMYEEMYREMYEGIRLATSYIVRKF